MDSCLPGRAARSFFDLWAHSALHRYHFKENTVDFTWVNNIIMKRCCSCPCTYVTLSIKHRQMHSCRVLLSQHFVKAVSVSSMSRVAAATPSTRYTLSWIVYMVTHLTFWRRIFFSQISAHPVFKMWVIQKPNKVALWNKRHFEEKKMEIIQHV